MSHVTCYLSMSFPNPGVVYDTCQTNASLYAMPFWATKPTDINMHPFHSSMGISFVYHRILLSKIHQSVTHKGNSSGYIRKWDTVSTNTNWDHLLKGTHLFHGCGMFLLIFCKILKWVRVHHMNNPGVYGNYLTGLLQRFLGALFLM